MKKILLVEDQHLVRQGLKLMIEQREDFKVVSEASNGEEAVRLFDEKSIDIVVMDIRMPKMNGLEATKQIKIRHPEAKILMLTTFDDDEYAIEALKYGACGYMLKDTDGSRLIAAIESCLTGGMTLDESVAAKVVPRLLKKEVQQNVEIPLTKREYSIVKLVGEGRNNQEIAKSLCLSVGTVKNHISHILDKLELRDRTQLAIFAVKNDLIK
ncbi:DNA-binding response regulator [Anaerobacillus alkalidiazotrophicus]|uniref:DNA-binding response regulator n=1 Tax=Anaerobacillus alkalidiazotrophicus TaxID=472963 RepID=A0A1S2MCD6_9BACI|nr:response regulator transcription factor [Anaerobacillus alkalidiazotrophicus]OIJ21345.1 DNA-binding response regulator [Anaerobacillus alkalidiazotrophicus]